MLFIYISKVKRGGGRKSERKDEGGRGGKKSNTKTMKPLQQPLDFISDFNHQLSSNRETS